MKKTMLMNMALLVLATALSAPPMTAQKADPAEVQLKAAIQKEVEDGDLKGAIGLYSKLAESPNRAIAAKALVQMGQCQEKLGQAEARKSYERAIRDFADQKESLAEKTAQAASGITMQRIATFTDQRQYTSISQDGRYLIFVKTDGLYLHDLVKGGERRIAPKASNEKFYSPIIFPDGKQVAYVRGLGQASSGFSRWDLYVIGIDGSNQRLLTSRNSSRKEDVILWLQAISRDGKQVAYSVRQQDDDPRVQHYVIDTGGLNPRLMISGEKAEDTSYSEWSPDGKYLLVGFYNYSAPGSSRLVMVSVADGSPRVVGTSADYGTFSPDGRFIAFYRYPYTDLKTQMREGLYLAATEGGKEVLLVRGATSNPAWTPDGKRILFLNQRPDQSDPRNPNNRHAFIPRVPCDVYAIWVKNGQPEGKPELMKKDVIVPGWMLGATQDGSTYFSSTANESSNIYVVNFDPATGKVASKPSLLNLTIDYSNRNPRWSPDGQWFAYRKMNGPDILMIGSTRTGEEHELIVSPPLVAAGYWVLIQWFPDNRSILVFDQKDSRKVFRKIDVQTGKQQMLFEPPGDETLYGWAALSLDGKEIFFTLYKPSAAQSPDPKITRLYTLRFMRRNLESGEQKELYQMNSPSKGTGPMISGDGRQLAFVCMNLDNTLSLRTIPANGGDARELYRSALLLLQYSWSKDGRHIFITQSDPSSGMQQLWYVSAQSGEHASTGLTLADIRGVWDDHDGRRLIFCGRQQPGQTELWVTKLLPSGPKP